MSAAMGLLIGGVVGLFAGWQGEGGSEWTKNCGLAGAAIGAISFWLAGKQDAAGLLAKISRNRTRQPPKAASHEATQQLSDDVVNWLGPPETKRHLRSPDVTQDCASERIVDVSTPTLADTCGQSQLPECRDSGWSAR